VSESRSVPIRPVAVILIVLLVPLNCWWVAVSTVRAATCLTQVSLYFNAIFTVAVLIGVNAVCVRWLPRAFGRRLTTGLNRAELIIYTCVSVGSGIAGVDRLLVLMPLMVHAHGFASAENDWQGLFFHAIPRWLVVADRSAIDGYYRGSATLYTRNILHAWLPIILWWSALIVALKGAMLALNLALRKQWIVSERLSYPVIRLPFEITEPGNRFFRSRWMWFGFGIGVAVDLVNGLNYLIPSIPNLGGRLFDLATILTERPWNAIGWSPLAVFPFAVGMSFFIPLDLAFSCWTFWILWRAERILFAIIGRSGQTFGGTVSFESEQSHGAYIGLCVVALWMSRHHLRDLFRRVLNGGSPEGSEPFAYRTVVIGLVVASAFIAFVSFRMGMSVWVIVPFWTIWFAIAVAITRLRAELGSPVHDLHFIGPDEILPRLFGTRRLGVGNLTAFTYLYWLNRAHRSHGMPHQLEGLKLAELAHIPTRRFAALMMLSAGLGALASFWAFLWISYHEGGSQWGWEAFNRLERWLTNPTPPNLPALGFISVGFLSTVLLAGLRMRYLWWNLHPVGYAVSGSWAINPMIGSIFVGWLLKWVALQFGGVRILRRANPFFLGLILGEFVAGSFWSILGIVLKREMYRFLF
jgi:hypothetical protein